MTRLDEALARRLAARPRVFYGWWIVFLAVLLNIYQGGILFYGFTLLVGPMQGELGWSMTNISLVFPIMGALSAIGGPLMGLLFDRVGPRPILAVGMLVMGAGMVLWANSHSLLAFYVTFILTQGGSAGIGVATGAAVPNWFIRQRGRALGIYSMGYALSGVMALPFLWLIDGIGWRGALIALGVVTWLLLIPAVMVIRRRPEDYGLHPDGDAVGAEASERDGAPREVNLSVREALRTRAFWLLALGFSMAFLTISAIQVHEEPYLRSVGFSRQQAALLLTAIPLSTIVGRLGFGFLSDFWDKRRASALALALQGVAILFLASLHASQAWLIPLFLAFWGLGFGGTVVTRPALQAELFGRFSFGTLQGLLWTTSELGFAVAPVAAGFVYDVLGTYRPVFLAFAILTLLASPIVLAIPKPRVTAGPP